MVKEVLGLFLGQVESIVDETPSEVLDVELAVAVVVHGFEDSSDSLNAARRALQQLCLRLVDQVFDRESLELLHRQSVAGVRRVACKPDVLVVLELRWNVTS